MRKKLKTRPDSNRVNLWKGLNVDENKREEYNSYLRGLFSKYKTIHKVVENIWNDKNLEDNEVCILLIAVGRGQAQSEMIEESKKALRGLTD